MSCYHAIHVFSELLTHCIWAGMYRSQSSILKLFIYFLLAALSSPSRGLSLVVPSGISSSLDCVGCSLQWLLLWWSMGSRHAGVSSCGSPDLKHRLSSCGPQAWLLRGTWDLPRPGIEPVSPAWAGRFLSTLPPGKSLNFHMYSLRPFFFFFF